MVDGSPEPIESQFKLGYGSAALLIGTGAEPEVIRKRIESSFGQYQNLKRIREIGAEVHGLETALAEARAYAAPCGDFPRIGRYRRARHEVEAAAAGDRARRAARRARVGGGRARAAGAGPPAQGGPELAVILGVHAIRGHRVLVDALLPHGAVVRLKSGVIKRIFWATPPLYVAATSTATAATTAAACACWPSSSPRLDVAGADRSRARAGAGGRAGRDRVPSLPVGLDGRVRPAPGRRSSGSTERLGSSAEALEAFRGAYWQEFLRVVEVLEQFGAVRERALEPKGRLDRRPASRQRAA